MSSIRIVHLSDLHFRRHERKPETVWLEVCKFIHKRVEPSLILVSGDVTDRARRDEFDYAKECLDHLTDGGRLPFGIIPGNHDRFAFSGNTLNWLSRVPGIKRWARDKAARFSETFKGAQHLTPDNAWNVTLQAQGGSRKWNLRILGIDSSETQKLFAQGAVSPKTIETASWKASDRAEDRDLVIALVHHHVLPIPAAEAMAQETFWGNFINVTALTNAGALLEGLSNAHVNLVLHGHKHFSHQARYGVQGPSSGDVVVLAAGSGTGEKTRAGWSLDRVHFNVIQLDDDGTIWLREVCDAAKARQQSGSHAGQDLKGPLGFAPKKLLLRPEDIRRSRFMRRYRTTTPARRTQPPSEARAEPGSRLMKFIEFTASRDIRITETRTNVTVPGRWTQRTRNSTGILEPVVVTFEWMDGMVQSAPYNFVRADKARSGSDDDAPRDNDHEQHRLDLDFGKKGMARGARRATAEWMWRGGAALTAAELQSLPPEARTGLRAQKMEFGAVEIISERDLDDEFEAVSLLVNLPPAFAPNPADVRIFVKAPDQPFETSPELQHALEFCGLGLMALRIPYPRPGFLYAIAWPVSDRNCVPEESQRYTQFARQNGRELIDRAAEVLRREPWFANASVALYGADAPNVQSLNLQGTIGPRSLERLDKGHGGSYTRVAWWGGIMVARKSEAEYRWDFHDQDELIALAPIRAPEDLGKEALGILRVGLGSDALSRPDVEKWQAHLVPSLAEAARSVLQHARLNYDRGRS